MTAATRPAPLSATVDQYRAAGERLARARTAVNVARDALRAAETAATGAEHDRAVLAAGAMLTVRALANRDQTAPVIVRASEYDGPATEYRAALGRARVSRRRADRGAAPRWTAYGWADSAESGRTETATIFEPERGSNDPDKLEAQRIAAEAAALAWTEPYTGAAWLAARGIAPVDPADVLDVDAYARRDGSHPGAYVATAYITAGGRLVDDALQLAELRSFEFAYGLGNDRRPVLPPDVLATLQGLTRGDVPIADLVADSPAETERRIGAVRDLLTANRSAIIGAWLAGFVTDDRPR